jgi:hypothetical protein
MKVLIIVAIFMASFLFDGKSFLASKGIKIINPIVLTK